MSTVLQALRHAGELPIEAVPDVATARKFSVETEYDADASPTPCGAHKPYRFLPNPKLQLLIVYLHMMIRVFSWRGGGRGTEAVAAGGCASLRL